MDEETKDKSKKINHETYKDPINDDSFIQQPSLTMSLSVRANLHKFLILGVISFLLMTAISSIPDNGLRIYDILAKPSVSKTTSTWWLNILKYRIEESTLMLPLYAGLLICLIMAIYYVVDAKLTEYNVNFRYIEIKKGVFNRTFDTIDLIHVKDQILERPFIFRILGISRLIVLSNDKSTPELKISAVDKDKAQLFLDFLRQNAFQNFTEYKIANDRRNRNEKGRKNKGGDLIGDDGDDDN